MTFPYKRKIIEKSNWGMASHCRSDWSRQVFLSENNSMFPYSNSTYGMPLSRGDNHTDDNKLV
jgi:hypothetical protein